jgi:hypothetical protein
MSSAGNWVELEVIILSEISQMEKENMTCFLPYVEART